jgi:hypothetical protein
MIFPPDSRLKCIDGFVRWTSLNRIEIPLSVEVIASNAFSECSGLKEVTFAPDGCLRIVRGFQRCRSLSRIEIPASVEKIDYGAFSGCSGLTEVIFATNGRLKRISGFGRCHSLSRLEIPASVERIGPSMKTYLYLCTNPKMEEFYRELGSLGDLSRRELIFRSGTRLRPNDKEDWFRGFVIFEDENDLKRRRRQVRL